jgi:hypothetical protein
MLESFVRMITVSTVRVTKPLPPRTSSERLSIVAEASFAALRNAVSLSNDARFDPTTITVTDELSSMAEARIAELEGMSRSDVVPMSTEERAEAVELGLRLNESLRKLSASLPRFDPRFPGCGFVDEAIGDILLDHTLVEAKAVQRPFRSADIRQVLVYAALNHSSQLHRIEAVALVNPRMGTQVVETLDWWAMAVAGIPSTDLLEDICHFMSSGDISR